MKSGKESLAPSRKAGQVTGEARHPERMRGIQERFLPEFTLSLAEGVEMTKRVSLRSGLLGAINFVEVVLSNI